MIKFSINWATILFYSTFISYGYFASMALSFDEVISNPLAFLFKNVVLASVLFIFGYCSVSYKNYFQDRVTLSYRNLSSILIIAIILLLLGNDLNESLISDEIAYSSVALAYPDYIASIIMEETALFDDYQYATLVQVCSAFIILSFFLLFFVTNKLTFNKKIWIFISILILIRVLVSFIHGNSFPHPPLNLIPMLVFGTLFGIDDVVLKLSFFIGYLFFICTVNIMVSRNYEQLISFMLTLCIATIPLFLNFAFRIEHSLWGGIAITIVLLELVTAQKVNYIRMFSFISIFSMIRMPVFIASVPLLLHYIFFQTKSLNPYDMKAKIPEIILMLLPIAIFLPFLINSIVIGTPSTNQNESFYSNISIAFQSGIIFDSLINSVSWLWIVLMIPALILFELKKVIIIFITLILLIFMYFSIGQSHWGETKYQLEWFVPFSAIGLIALLNYLIKIKIPKVVVILFLGSVVIFNCYQYRSLLERQLPIDYLIDNYEKIENPNIGLYKIGYDYKSAYDYIIKNEFQDSTYSVGVTYGIFPELLNKYSVKSYREVKNIHQDIMKYNKMNNVKWTSADAENIDSNEKINHLMVGLLLPDKVSFLEDMANKGWQIEKKFYAEKYKSTIFLLKRY